jgi:hypothetical protein
MHGDPWDPRAAGRNPSFGGWETLQFYLLHEKKKKSILGVELAHLPFSILGFCLVWACGGLMHAASLCEFTPAPVLLCLDNTVSLESATTSDSYNLSTRLLHRPLTLEGRDWMWISFSTRSFTPEHCCSTAPRQLHCLGTRMAVS